MIDIVTIVCLFRVGRVKDYSNEKRIEPSLLERLCGPCFPVELIEAF